MLFRICLLLALSALAGPVRAAASEFTEAAQILERAMRRSQSQQELNPYPPYQYDRIVVTEELNSKGAIIKRKERTTPVNEAERARKRELAKDDALKAKPGDGKYKAPRDVVLEEELVAKYEFTLRGRDTLNGRPAYLLTFEPRAKLPAPKLEDRVLNRLQGKMWIDAEEFEIAKLEVWLAERVTLGWGIVAALHALDFSLQRTRTSDGFWLPSGTQGAVRFRQLIDSKSIRWRENISSLSKLTEEQTRAAAR